MQPRPRICALSLALAVVLMSAGQLHARPLEPHEWAPDLMKDRSGYPELVMGSAGYGLVMGLLGAQIIAPDGGLVELAVGAGLGAAVGLFTPMLLTLNASVHTADVMMYSVARRWGLTTGALLPFLWGGRITRDGQLTSGGERRMFAASSAGLSLAALTGAVLAREHIRMNPGQVSALGSGHTFGGLLGSFMMLMFNRAIVSPQDVAAPALLFSNIGLLGAVLARDVFDVSRERIILTDIGGYGGALVGGALGFLITGTGRRRGNLPVFGATLFAGTLLGLVTTFLLTDHIDAHKNGIDMEKLRATLGKASTEQRFELLMPTMRLFSTLDEAGQETQVGYGMNLLEARW